MELVLFDTESKYQVVQKFITLFTVVILSHLSSEKKKKKKKRNL